MQDPSHLYNSSINKYLTKNKIKLSRLYKSVPTWHCRRLESCDHVAWPPGGHSNGSIVAQRRSGTLWLMVQQHGSCSLTRLSYVTKRWLLQNVMVQMVLASRGYATGGSQQRSATRPSHQEPRRWRFTAVLYQRCVGS